MREHRRQAPARTAMVLAAVALLGMLFVVPAAAHAEPDAVLAQAQSLHQVLRNIRNWLMGILAMLATVFATVGGVRYVIAGGDPGEIERAKTAFKAAGIGFALAALAPLLVTVLSGIVGL